MENKEIKETILGVVAIVAVVVLAIVFTQDTEKQEIQPQVAVEEKSTLHKELENGFLEGCFDGTNFESCKCGFDYMISELGTEGFIEMALEYDETGVEPDIIFESLKVC